MQALIFSSFRMGTMLQIGISLTFNFHAQFYKKKNLNKICARFLSTICTLQPEGEILLESSYLLLQLCLWHWQARPRLPSDPIRVVGLLAAPVRACKLYFFG